MTERLYWDDPYQRGFDAEVVASRDGRWALSRTAFYPGGGGQPADVGVLRADGQALAVTVVTQTDDGLVWHDVGADIAVGLPATGEIEWDRRYALMRGHALLHVVNTVAAMQFGGVITGAEIGRERSRIDFRLPSFDRGSLASFEALVNEVVRSDRAVTSSSVSEEELARRPELVRTLNVSPPVVDGRVRVVEIAGFDTQACGGTHVHSTGEIGQARLERFDNKGRDNKRFYWSATLA